MPISVKKDLTIDEQLEIFAELIVNYLIKNIDQINAEIAEDEKSLTKA
jgi:hypothetical protein